jgi:hypothetical protein
VTGREAGSERAETLRWRLRDCALEGLSASTLSFNWKRNNLLVSTVWNFRKTMKRTFYVFGKRLANS